MKCKKIQQKIAESRALPLELSHHIEKCPECGTFKRDLDEIRSALQHKAGESTPDWLRRQTLDNCLDNLLPGKDSLPSRIKSVWRSYWIVLALSLAFVLLLTVGIVDACVGQNDEQMRQICTNIILFVLLQNILVSMFLPLFIYTPFHRPTHRLG